MDHPHGRSSLGNGQCLLIINCNTHANVVSISNLHFHQRLGLQVVPSSGIAMHINLSPKQDPEQYALQAIFTFVLRLLCSYVHTYLYITYSCHWIRIIQWKLNKSEGGCWFWTKMHWEKCQLNAIKHPVIGNNICLLQIMPLVQSHTISNYKNAINFNMIWFLQNFLQISRGRFSNLWQGPFLPESFQAV